MLLRMAGPLATQKSARTAPVELTPGHPLATGGRGTRVVILLALRMSAEDLRSWTELVAQVQVETAGFRPLWLVDDGHLASIRNYGWASDHVISQASWDLLDQAEDYDDYVQRRVQLLAEHFGGAAVLPLSGQAPQDRSSRHQLALALAPTLRAIGVR